MDIPSKGERIEVRRTGISVRGTVFYSDQLQILVKWDNGRSSSLRVGSDRFAVVDRMSGRLREQFEPVGDGAKPRR